MIIDKTPYFKNHLKNPIFEIEGSNMDLMKEKYLTHMNLVLTIFSKCRFVMMLLSAPDIFTGNKIYYSICIKDIIMCDEKAKV